MVGLEPVDVSPPRLKPPPVALLLPSSPLLDEHPSTMSGKPVKRRRKTFILGDTLVIVSSFQ
jgi:hypothetical protein